MTTKKDTSPRQPYRRRLLALLPLVAFGALTTLFLVRLYEGEPTRVPSVLIGKHVPTFNLAPVEGLTQSNDPIPGLKSDDLRTGKIMIVNVWASWCVPCRQEHPLLMELARDPRVTVVGINYKDAPENARRFLGALGNPFQRVGADTTGRVGIEWGVYGVPETFIIAGDGTIRHKHIGPLTPEALATTIEQAIASSF